MKNKLTLGFFLLLLAILLWANFTMVAPYLLAVLMGGLLANLTNSLYHWLLNRKVPPRLAAGLITFGVVSVIIAPVGLFTMMSVSQGIETAQKLTKDQPLSIDYISEKVIKFAPAKKMLGDAKAVEAKINEGLNKIASAAPAVVFKIFGGLPEFVLQLLLALLSCYFLLVDGELFVAWLRSKLPLDPEARGAIFKSFHETAISTIVATIVAASIQSVIMVVGFIVLGVPAAFLAGGLTFVFAWIPILGSTPVWLGGAAYLFAQGSTTKAVLMIGFGVLTGISDNIVHPMVLKGRGEMHPLVSLVAIFGGIHLFGILGVFVGPILAALLIAALKVWPTVAERYGILKGSQIVTNPSAEPADASALVLPTGVDPSH